MPTEHSARVFARLLDWSNPSPSIVGRLTLRVEYSTLDAARKNGKYTLPSALVVNSSQLQQEITEGLVAYLNAQTPAPSPLYRERDIVLWGA